MFKKNLLFLFVLVFYRLNAQVSPTLTKIPLDEAFKKLEVQKKIHLAFDPDACSKFDVQDWNENSNVENILESILKILPFQYKKQEPSHYLIFFDSEKQKQLNLNSQIRTKIHINGTIQDVGTQENIPAAVIVLMPDGITNESDLNGNFNLHLTSRHTDPWIEIHYLGYQNQIIRNPSEAPSNLKIKLYPNIALLPAITISSQKPLLNVERISEQKNGLDRIQFQNKIQSNVFKDPMRALQQSPGVNATDDRSSGLQIRGSGSDENLIRLNGLTLFSVNHFYGVFSNINPYVISSIDLYKSYFPSNYGGRASSVIQLKSPSQLLGVHGGIDLNLISANAYLLTPLGQKINLIAGFRTTTFNLGNTKTFNSLLQNNTKSTDPLTITDSTELTVLNPSYKFNDFFTKLDYNVNARLLLSSSFFSSFDQLNSEYKSSLLNSGKVEGNFNEATKWINQAYNFNAKYSWSNSFSTDINLAHAYFNFNQNINSYTKVRNSIISEQSSVENTLANENIQLSNQLTIEDDKITFGLEYNYYNTKVYNTFNRINNISDSASRSEVGAFIQGEFKVNSKLIISPGIRLSKYQIRENLDMSPRYSMSYSWNNNFTSIANFGIYYQHLRQSRFEDRFGREYYLWIQSNDKQFPTLISKQFEFIQSYQTSHFSFKVEGYYKMLNGLVENLTIIQFPSNFNEAPKIRSEILKGLGRIYGVDFSFEHRMKHLQYYFIYSYNKSENSLPQIDEGKYYQKSLARTHQIKTNISYSLKNCYLSFNSVYGSPLPYSDVFISGAQLKDRKPKQETKLLDDYFRVDLDLKYKFNFKKSRMEIGLSILNIFDRSNTLYAQSLFTFPEQIGTTSRAQKYVVGAEIETLRRTLNLSLGYHF